MEKIRIGISACLLGHNVRYDGGHKHDRYLTDTLGRYIDWVPVCPEVEYGLSVPREAMRLVGDPEAPCLVTIRSGIDHTDGMKRWAAKRLDALAEESLCGFIFKSKSPSSGMKSVKVYGPSGMPVLRGVGIFARAFMDRFPLLPVEEEGRLHDPALRENFIERIFVQARWQALAREGFPSQGLVTFHSDHKLLILAHSPTHAAALGRLVADAGKRKDLPRQYAQQLGDALKLSATPRKHTNVLMHMMGYFKKQLSADEKQELLETLDAYRLGRLPLLVPLTLLRHYVRKYDAAYLKRQVYLDPSPAELMLRNSA